MGTGESKTTSRAARLLQHAGAFYLAIVGIGLVIAGIWAEDRVGSAGSAVLLLFGAGSLFIVPFASRIEGRLRLGALEMTIQKRVIMAVADAPTSSLEAILPVITGHDVSIAQMGIPRSFHGRQLIEPEFRYIRWDLGLSVIAVQAPGEDRWLAGGRVSVEKLVGGGAMLVCGPPETLAYFQMLTRADNERLWSKVRGKPAPDA